MHNVLTYPSCFPVVLQGKQCCEATLRLLATQLVVLLVSHSFFDATVDRLYAPLMARAADYIARQTTRYPLVYITLELGKSWEHVARKLVGLEEGKEEGVIVVEKGRRKGWRAALPTVSYSVHEDKWKSWHALAAVN